MECLALLREETGKRDFGVIREIVAVNESHVMFVCTAGMVMRTLRMVIVCALLCKSPVPDYLIQYLIVLERTITRVSIHRQNKSEDGKGQFHVFLLLFHPSTAVARRRLRQR